MRERGLLRYGVVVTNHESRITYHGAAKLAKYWNETQMQLRRELRLGQ
jgi:hypothetical protein